MTSATHIRRNRVKAALAWATVGDTNATRYLLQRYPQFAPAEAAAIILSAEVARLSELIKELQ